MIIALFILLPLTKAWAQGCDLRLTTRAHLGCIAAIPVPLDGFDSWSSIYGDCTKLTPRLAHQLKLRGVDVQLVSAGNALPVIVDGQSIDAGGIHVHIRIYHGDSFIIVDPTYRQFFEEEAFADEPDVFVGTPADLRALFERHARRVQFGRHRTQRVNPSWTGRYDVRAFVNKMYGFGEGGPTLRIRKKLVLETAWDEPPETLLFGQSDDPNHEEYRDYRPARWEYHPPRPREQIKPTVGPWWNKLRAKILGH